MVISLHPVITRERSDRGDLSLGIATPATQARNDGLLSRHHEERQRRGNLVGGVL